MKKRKIFAHHLQLLFVKSFESVGFDTYAYMYICALRMRQVTTRAPPLWRRHSTPPRRRAARPASSRAGNLSPHLPHGSTRRTECSPFTVVGKRGKFRRWHAVCLRCEQPCRAVLLLARRRVLLRPFRHLRLLMGPSRTVETTAHAWIPTYPTCRRDKGL